MLSHCNVIANVLQLTLADSVARRQLGVDTQATLCVLPFSHIYGLVLVGLVSQFRGGQTIVLPRFDLGASFAAVERHRVAQLSVVPPMLIALLADSEARARFDLSSVRWVFSGAATLGAEVLDGLRHLFPRWHLGQGYGMTEASPGIAVTSESDCLLGSSGSLIPGTQAKIVDAAGRELTALKTPGELLVQSPSVALGYLNNDRANAETFVWHADGRRLRTGDEVLVRRSPQGHEHLVVVDRIKELIKVKGHQVPPAELEAHLLVHPLVADCAVIPVPDSRAGQIPKASVGAPRPAVEIDLGNHELARRHARRGTIGDPDVGDHSSRVLNRADGWCARDRDARDVVGQRRDARVLSDIITAETLYEGDGLLDIVVVLAVSVDALVYIVDELLAGAVAASVHVALALLDLHAQEGVETLGHHGRARQSARLRRRLARARRVRALGLLARHARGLVAPGGLDTPGGFVWPGAGQAVPLAEAMASMTKVAPDLVVVMRVMMQVAFGGLVTPGGLDTPGVDWPGVVWTTAVWQSVPLAGRVVGTTVVLPEGTLAHWRTWEAMPGEQVTGTDVVIKQVVC